MGQLKINLKSNVRKKLISLVIFPWSVMGFSQDLQSVIPPSPTAASLAQYGEIPVSFYTGTPNISVPLYTIQSGKIELPISLNYNASGVKVAQEAGWVGLGWSLDAGGVITRSVLGRDDLETYSGGYGVGYVTVPEAPADGDLPKLDDPSTPAVNDYWYSIYSSIANGQYDGDPDIFYYNFLGHSGKMIFEKKESGSTRIVGRPLKQTNSKFIYDLDEQRWEVTDQNGWVYIFAAKEFTEGYTTTYDTKSPDTHIVYNVLNQGNRIDNLDEEQYNITRVFPYASSWFLTEIQTPEGDTITLEYDTSERRTISQLSFSERESHFQDGGPDVSFPAGNYGKWDNFQARFGLSGSMQKNHDIYLHKIIFKNGYVLFNTTDKEDIRVANSGEAKAQKLASLEVFDKDDNSLKKVVFNYSYFNQNRTGNNKENYWRLKLDGIQESYYNAPTGSYETIPPYTFTYNSTSLPAKTSTSIDYWGYYNGFANDNLKSSYSNISKHLYTSEGSWANSTVTIPGTSGVAKYSYIGKYLPRQTEVGRVSNSSYFHHIFTDGFFRDAVENKVEAAILERIDFPTGGASRFIYEANRYRSPDTDEQLFEQEFHKFSLAGANESGFSNPSRSFTLTSPYTLVQISCVMSFPGIQSTANLYARVTNLNNTEIIKFVPNSASITNQGLNSKVEAILPAGTYKFEANIPNTTGVGTSDLTVFMDVQYFSRIPTDEKLGGGVRIKELEMLDSSDDVVKKRSYSYEQGYPMSTIEPFYTEILYDDANFITPSDDLGLLPGHNIYIRSTQGNMPLSYSAQGNFVGYGKVTTSEVDNLENPLGRSVYYFTNQPDEKTIRHISGLPTYVHMDNGNLIREEHYNGDNRLIKSIVNQYTNDMSTRELSTGVYVKPTLWTTTSPINSFPGPYLRLYKIISEWWYLKSTTETLYGTEEGTQLATSVLYSYDNPDHKNLTKVEKENSTGEVLRTNYYYPPDLLDVEQNGLMLDLTNQNSIGQAVITETFVDNSKTSETHMVYGNSAVTGNVILPVEIHMDKEGQDVNISSTDDLKVKFHKYDTNGNPLEISNAEGVHMAYLWGYNSQYPVAKVENATYSQFAFTSFETTEKGGWTYSGTPVTTHKTGKKGYNLSSGSVTKTGIGASTSNPYRVGFWARRTSGTGNVNVGGQTESLTTTWKWVEKTITSSSLTISGSSVVIDELRIHPAGAMMTSFTYEPLVGMTSQTDPRGYTMIYSYDTAGRLMTIKNEDGHILEHYEYNYAVN